MAQQTDYDKQVERIRGSFPLEAGSQRDYQPSPEDFVKLAIGGCAYNGLYLCGKCGLTWDGECDYGGWHDQFQALEVRFAHS